ncbi:hypothetical protein Taro_009423 [Colocasia esculenta]|uniref:Uncharacterized protein n=1 Tax=Colocasia esculenta TaxID=4460 RepID=A0A843TWA8_COLES|nr:hypothetical protein [Colocasia esculenta]
MGKPAVVPFLLLTFLFLSTFAAAASDPVLDTDGKKLTRGTEYYILPASAGNGGGLTLDSRNGTECPLYVAKESSEASPGFPVAFFPYTHKRTVRVSTDANFVFSAASTCVQTTVWTLGRFEESTGRTFVATGGVVGRTGPEARGTWFRIETFEDGRSGYKLAFCPQPPVCVGCGKPRCGDLGLLEEGGKVWLGFSDSPLPVVFKRV